MLTGRLFGLKFGLPRQVALAQGFLGMVSLLQLLF
jgi:hypothetical protein